MSTLGNRLKFLRKINNKTQREVAESIGVGKTAISNYENDKAVPSVQTIIALAKHFGVDVAYLVGQADRMNEPGAKYVAAKKVALVSEQTAMDLPKLIAVAAEEYVEAPIHSAGGDTFAVNMVECEMPVMVIAERGNGKTEFVLCVADEKLRIFKRSIAEGKNARILGGVLFFM